MSGLQTLAVTLCYICVAVSIISLLSPQKRTRRVMGFVVGLFFISVMASAVASQIGDIDLSAPEFPSASVPAYNEVDYEREIAQMTADNLTTALDELLHNEGINARDIQLTLKISDEGRISVIRAVIYISEEDRDRIADVESIVYRNIAKEPQVYVKEEASQ